MTKINLLLAEDNDTDALLLVRQLRKEGFEVEHLQVKSKEEMDAALQQGGWDIVISDYSMPGFGGGDALELFKSKEMDIPFILVSGTVGEDIAVNIMKGGANDYLMKTHLNRLGPAVKRELAETRMRREKSRVESILSQTEKRFRRLIRDLPDLVWLSDIRGEQILIINSAFEHIFGSGLGEELRMRPLAWRERVDSSDVEMYDQFLETLNQRGTNTLEYRITHSGGQERWVRDQRYIIPADDTGEDMVGGILSDITPMKLSEQELIRAKRSAEESSRLKSALLQNMSHEFRTPMNGILGFSEILRGELTEENTRAMSEHIHISGKRLQQTLDSIMLYAQLEGGLSLRPVEIDLIRIIENVCECQGQALLTKKLSLEFRHDPGIVIKSDETLVQRTLYNLIENAVKFTSKGGVTILASRLPSGGAEVRIKDSGIGIPQEKQQMIFEEFRQAEEGFNRPYEGSGLGLAIARKAMSTIGGSICLTSTVGEGSEFTLSFPGDVHAPPAVPQQQTTASIRPASVREARARSILLVEDNEANIELVKMFLRGSYHLDVAQSGSEALAMVAERGYDAILMDINLGPGMDGTEAIKAIRQMPEYGETPVIAVTGYTLRNEKEHILACGANYYLEKPFRKQTLCSLLDDILAGSQDNKPD